MDHDLEARLLQLAVQQNRITPVQLAKATESPAGERISFLLEDKSLQREDLDALRSLLEIRDLETLQDFSQGQSVSQQSDSTSSARPSPGSSFGRFLHLEQIGQGGMARVYKAFDPSLGRTVAVKVLRLDDPIHAQRLLQEARAQAKIEHQHICKVFEAGEVEGKPYIAMQYIQGKTLKEVGPQLTELEKVQIIEEVAEAVHTANEKGIIHRDLKPANILIEKSEAGSWVPHVVDFGVAREVEAPGLTMTGIAIGTPSYMSPEQVRGGAVSVDQRTDVYSLGATLYDLLTGRPPFDGGSSVDVLMKALHEEPLAPSIKNKKLSGDLETIIMKCLEKDPARRYSSCRELSKDLRRFREGEPITARPSTWTYRLGKKARKNKAIAIVACLSILLILSLIGLILWTRWVISKQAEWAIEFGQEVRFIESSIRSAYSAPLHDLRPQLNQIRARLKKVEARIQSEGTFANGPGYDALGQGYLAVNDHKKAQEYLEKAWNIGYRQPSTAYALGRVMEHFYALELENVANLPSADLRAQKKKEAEVKYATPSAEYLKRGKTHVESPVYVEALVALTEEQFDTALVKAREAHHTSSWPYEPKKLEGDIYMAIGRTAVLAEDPKKAIAAYDNAGKAYSEAEELARSHEEIHLAQAARWRAMIGLQSHIENPQIDFLEKSLESCNKALIANPDDDNSRLCSASTYMNKGEYVMYWDLTDPSSYLSKAAVLADRAAEKGDNRAQALNTAARAFNILAERASYTKQDPRNYLKNAIARSENALRQDPQSYAYFELAASYYHLGEYQQSHGSNPLQSLQKVLDIFQNRDQKILGQTYVQNTLGLTLVTMGEYKLQRGDDPRPELQKAIPLFEQALQTKPKSVLLALSFGVAYQDLAMYELRQGRDPLANCKLALRYCDQALANEPNYAAAEHNKGQVYLLIGEYELLQKKDPEETLRKAIHQFQTAIKVSPELTTGYLYSAAARSLLAQAAIQRSKDPLPTLKQAESEARFAAQLGSEFFESYRVLGEIQILNAHQHMIEGKSPLAELKNARKFLEESIRINPNDAISYVDMAQTYKLEVEWWKKKRLTMNEAQAATEGQQWIAKAKQKDLKDPRFVGLENLFHLTLTAKQKL